MEALKILFFGKKNLWGDIAVSYLENLNQKMVIYKGNHGDKFPEIKNDSWDLIVSFSSPWIIPKTLLDKASIAAINFHPGSPNYPGIGCTNFALYAKERRFGVVAHHMQPKVDSGDIIAARYFPVFENDSVKTLTDRTYYYLYTIFIEVMDAVINYNIIPTSSEKWSRTPFTRKELNDLCEISLDMSPDEITRRVKAVTFPGKPGAYMKLNNFRFLINIENDL